MRIGVSAGPFWVSSGGGRRPGRIGVLGGWFILSLLCGNWFGSTVAVWMLWLGIPALVLVGAVARHRGHRERRRPPTAPAATPPAPRNPRMYHSDRR